MSKYILSFIFLLSVLAGPAAQAGSFYERGAIEALFKQSLDLIRTPEDFESMANLIEMPNEASEKIMTRLRQAGSTDLPKLTVEKNQIYSNGKATGISVIAFQPFSLRFKGEIWKYNSSQSADSNFEALLRLFSGKPAFARISLLPFAHAQLIADD